MGKVFIIKGYYEKKVENQIFPTERNTKDGKTQISIGADYGRHYR